MTVKALLDCHVLAVHEKFINSLRDAAVTIDIFFDNVILVIFHIKLFRDVLFIFF